MRPPEYWPLTLVQRVLTFVPLCQYMLKKCAPPALNLPRPPVTDEYSLFHVFHLVRKIFSLRFAIGAQCLLDLCTQFQSAPNALLWPPPSLCWLQASLSSLSSSPRCAYPEIDAHTGPPWRRCRHASLEACYSPLLRSLHKPCHHWWCVELHRVCGERAISSQSAERRASADGV